MFEALLIGMLLTYIAADFLDKKSAQRADSYAMALWTNTVQFLLLLPLIGLIDGMPISSIALCFLVALFSCFGRLQWYKALAEKKESLSRLSPLTEFSGLLVLAAAFIWFNELFSAIKGAGGALMIAGAAILGFENFKGSWKLLLESNRAIGLVLIFAASSASITILYKLLLNDALAILTIYFFLKAFQSAIFISHAIYHGRFTQSFSKIQNLRIFVSARILQTLGALVYLFVIQGHDLSKIAPLAALSPLMVIIVERILRYLQVEGTGREDYNVKTRVTALVVISLGAISLYFG